MTPKHRHPIENGAEPIPLTQGDYAIPWFTGSREDSVDKTILADDGEEVGTLSLSPLDPAAVGAMEIDGHRVES